MNKFLMATMVLAVGSGAFAVVVSKKVVGTFILQTEKDELTDKVSYYSVLTNGKANVIFHCGRTNGKNSWYMAIDTLDYIGSDGEYDAVYVSYRFDKNKVISKTWYSSKGGKNIYTFDQQAIIDFANKVQTAKSFVVQLEGYDSATYSFKISGGTEAVRFTNCK